MKTRLQFTLPEDENLDILNRLSIIAPNDKAFIATTRAPNRPDSILLIVLTNDEELEFLLRLKYAGYETYITRF